MESGDGDVMIGWEGDVNGERKNEKEKMMKEMD